MSPLDSDSRLAAFVTKIVLLGVVIGATGALAGSLFVPTAVALTDVVDAVDADIFDVPPLPDTAAPPQNSFIYAADGSEIAEINYQESRIPVTLEQIPEVTRDAVIATEDASFYEHNGVNHRAIVRAALANARAGDVQQGGSTITQQYVKNAYLTADQTLDRKIKEALYAVELEKRLTKDEILEAYLNRTYFGSGVYGIGTAARRYFSKDVEELTLAESAMLAGLIRFPEGNNPLKDEVAARQRRDIVLGQMANHGFITAAQRDAAQQTPLGINPSEPDNPDFPFWVDFVTRILIEEDAAEALGSQTDALELMGEDSPDRIATVFQSGLRIHTTLDPEFQTIAEESVREALTYEGETPAEVAQEPFGGLISVEPGTGAIRTMAIGPREYGACEEPVGTDDQGRLLCDKTKFNPLIPSDVGSSRAGRQPGSSFKPFVVAAALEKGIPPGWQVDATGPATIPGCDNGGPWKVNNSGGDGLRDMYSGVKASSNVFHAKLIKETGPANVVDMATRLGVRRSELPSECSLALGAVEVFPLEMAAAYATLANRGEYCAPFAIERIENSDGEVIYEHTADCEQVLEQPIADRVIDIMDGPVTAGGTAPVANLGAWDTRGKTGTTNDYVDAWFVGYVKQLATAAWVGYENGIVTYDCEANPDKCAQETSQCFDVDTSSNTRKCVERQYMRNVTIGGDGYRRIFGGTIPAPMWKSYMSRAVERFEPARFSGPGALPGATVPDVVSTGSIAEAEELAEAAKLNLIVETVSDYRPEGTFVGQSPEPGTRVPAGRAVVLQVSDGSGERPVLPNFVGAKEEDAVRILGELGYGVKIVERETRRPEEQGKVLAQSPSAGQELEPGDDVVVVLQVGVAPKNEEPPEETEEPTEEPTPSEEPTDEPSPSPSPEPEPEPEPSPSPDGGGNGNGNGNGRGNGSGDGR